MQPSCSLETTTGNFGDVDSIEPIILQYVYEVVIEPASSDLLEEEIIPSLELAMVNFLLPGLFEGDCESSGRRLHAASFFKSSRHLQENIIGISSSPADLTMPRGKDQV